MRTPAAWLQNKESRFQQVVLRENETAALLAKDRTHCAKKSAAILSRLISMKAKLPTRDKLLFEKKIHYLLL